MIDFQRLRYAVALGQALHFGRAAEQLHVTQPTLSQQILRLEQELGVALFERSSRRVRLTEAGRRFLPRAMAILDSVNALAGELQEEARRPAGKVRVGVIPTICPYLMPKVVVALKRSAPEVLLEIQEETTSRLVEDLLQGQLELGILALPIERRGLARVAVGEEPFYLAVAQRHPLARRRQVRPEEVARQRLLVLQEGHCFRDQALAYCKQAARQAQVIFQGSSLGSVLRLAAAGEGVTFVPQMALEDARRLGLRAIPFVRPEPVRRLGIVWRVTAPLTPAQKAVMEVVEQQMEVSHAQ